MASSGSNEVVPIRAGVEDETYVYDTAPHAGLDDPTSDPLAQPTKVGRYVLLETIGTGGMGVVCTAFDPKLDRKVALKLLKRPAKPTAKRTRTAQLRLIREAQALAKLNHPNIITVHDVDTFDGRIYMAMEFVEGRTLGAWLAEKRRGWKEILQAFDHAGKGLAAAHAANITHRDFKPSNVLVGRDGRIRVLDFGLAKHAERHGTEGEDAEPADEADDEQDAPRLRGKSPSNQLLEEAAGVSHVKLTQAGRIVGTPAYMAPEQHRKGKIGPWTDQFSFAVVLYESLYGRLPFPGKYLEDVWYHIKNGLVRDPPKHSEVPSWILRVLRRAMHAEPEQRYGSMEELLALLRADPAKKRRQILAWAAAVPVIGFGGYGVFMMVQPDVGMCTGAEERLVDVWDDAQRDTVEEALRATGTAYAADTATRVSTALDAYAEAWAADRTTVCEATRIKGEQSETLLDVRMTCLDQRRNELRALVGVLADADETVTERAIQAVASLRPTTTCLTAQPGDNTALPKDPEKREVVEALLRRHDEARALMAAGRYAAALELMNKARERAERLEHLPTLAKLLVLTGQAHRQLGNLDEAERFLTEAVVSSGKAGDARSEAEAWVSLVHLVGYGLDDAARGKAWRLPAENALARLGGSESLRRDLLLSLGSVELRANRFAEARALHEEALSLATTETSGKSLEAAKILSNLGVLSFRLGDRDRAEKELREAYSLTDSALGAEHPETARVALALGNVLPRTPEALQEAQHLYEKALKIREGTYGADSVEVAQVLNSLGGLHLRQGNPENAEDAYARALEVFQARPETALYAANTLNNLGLLAGGQRDHALAAKRHTEAIELLVQKYGTGHLQVGVSQQHLCRALRESADLHRARQHCEEALKIFKASYGGSHERVAETIAELGNLELELGNKKAAEERLRQALAIHGEIGSPADVVRPLRSLADGL